MELRLISQASLARPIVCGFMVVQAAVSRWHSPSFTSEERGWEVLKVTGRPGRPTHSSSHPRLPPTPSETSGKELGHR